MNTHKAKTLRDVRLADQQASQAAVDWFSVSDKGSDLGGLKQLSRTLGIYRWSILVLTLLGVAAGAMKALSDTPVYRAQLSLVVDPGNSVSQSNSGGLFDPYGSRFYTTQYELIRSRAIATRVVDVLGLVDRESIERDLLPPSLLQKLRRIISSFPGLTFLRSEEDTAQGLSQQVGDINSRREWLISVVQSGAQVSGDSNSQLIRVAYDSPNPVFASEVANSLVDAYIASGLDTQNQRTEESSVWLTNRLSELKVQLIQAEKNLQDYLYSERLIDSDRSDEITSQELTRLNAEYLDAQSKFSDLSERYGAKHPRITEVSAELRAAESRWLNASQNVVEGKSKQVGLAELEREVKATQELYDVFLAKFRETDLSSRERVSSARVVDRARPPTTPIYPDNQRTMLVWGVAGFLIGIGISLIREQLNSTFSNIQRIEEELRVPLFGVVPFLKLDATSSTAERHYIENNRSPFAEAINHIRTGILYSDVDDPPQVVLVTSSVQGEGKTTVSSNLALAFAQLGSTLLIDADLRRPRIKRVTGANSPYGLVDYVAGEVKLKDCVNRDANVPGLYVINGGTPPPNPLELLSSERLRRIMQNLRSKFQYIIVDTAPVLPASDAIVLGQLVDSLIMVVQAERTTGNMAKDAMKRMAGGNVVPTGIVLAQADVRKSQSYYDGKYQYYYGGYYGSQ